MSRFKLHIFVCENKRSEDDERGSCGMKCSADIRARFKHEIKARGLKGIVRANQAGCLDACEHGPAVVIYPEETWYGHVTPDDVPEILDAHLNTRQPVERLLISL